MNLEPLFTAPTTTGESRVEPPTFSALKQRWVSAAVHVVLGDRVVARFLFALQDVVQLDPESQRLWNELYGIQARLYNQEIRESETFHNGSSPGGTLADVFGNLVTL